MQPLVHLPSHPQLEITLFMLCLTSLGNVYIHPTANIDPTAVVIIPCRASFLKCACLPLKKKKTEKHEYMENCIFFLCKFSWVPMSPLALE